MKIRILLTTLVLGMTLSNLSHANDINMSWSVNTLKSQALTHIVKKAQLKKFSQKHKRKILPAYSTKDIQKTVDSKYP